MDHQPFLRAIRAKPEDDLPRLVYADALEESGASERAEFIRVQVALANTPEHDPQFRVLEDHEHELLWKNERAWMGNPTVTPQEWTWHRGFVDEVIGPERDLMGLRDCLKNQVVTKLEVTEQDSNLYTIEIPFPKWLPDLRMLTLHGLHESSHWWPFFEDEHIKLHSLSSSRLPAEVMFNMLRIGAFRNQLNSFRFQNPHGDGDFALDRELCDMQDINELFEYGNLTELQLTELGNAIDHSLPRIQQLMESNSIRNVTSLDLSYNQIGSVAYRSFQKTSAQLQSLGLSGTPLAAISLKHVLEARSTQSLKSLEVNGTGSARTNLEAVANSRFWSQAERFSASQGTIQASTFEPLTKSGSLNLRHLDLGGNYLRTEGVRYLCEAPWADSLTYLSLWNNYLDDESCEVLAKSGRFKNLRTLNLSHNNAMQRDSDGEQITDRGIIALCKSPAFANLRMLALGNNPIGDAAFEAIFKAPLMLSALYLNGTRITQRSIKTLVNSPKLARLNTLNLSDNPNLGGQVLFALAKSPYLSPLCELDLSGIQIHPTVVQVFRERLGRRFTYSG